MAEKRCRKTLKEAYNGTLKTWNSGTHSDTNNDTNTVITTTQRLTSASADSFTNNWNCHVFQLGRCHAQHIACWLDSGDCKTREGTREGKSREGKVGGRKSAAFVNRVESERERENARHRRPHPHAGQQSHDDHEHFAFLRSLDSQRRPDRAPRPGSTPLGTRGAGTRGAGTRGARTWGAGRNAVGRGCASAGLGVG